MDKTNSHQAGMEGQRIQMCSESGPGPGQSKLMNDAVFSKYLEPHKPALGKFQSSEMAWKTKALTMPQSQHTDYSDMNVSIAGAKLTGENLRLKNTPEPHGEECMDCDNDLDIDKRLAAKKVVPPTETKDETVPDPSLNVLHKQRPQKRTIDQSICELTAYDTLNPDTLKVTEEVIQKINTNPYGSLEICLKYNPQHFSNKRNLTVVPYTKMQEGSFGNVTKVKDSQTGKILVQKQVKKNSKGKFEIEKNEIEVPLQFADVENIARVFGLYWYHDELLYFMEDAGISLRQLVSDKESNLLLVPGRIEKIMLDVFTALSYLAAHHITHCDIKPENICLNLKTGVAKLIDFGSCKTPQDVTDYKGTTPEYLDPVANKFLHEFFLLRNKDYPMHKLDCRDDVFGAGLVGLSLIMKVHPMTYFFLGCDIVVEIKLRFEVMKKISELTDRQMSQLLDRPMSDIMRNLLQGVLNLDRAKRWTAKEAVRFLQGKLRSYVQPPNKVCRYEPQSCSTQAEEQQEFINLRRKDSDKVPAQMIQKCELPGSPDIDHGQGLGIVMKGPAASTQTGGILLPAKLKLMPPLQQPSPQHQQHQQHQQPQQQGRVWCSAGSEGSLSAQESRDYSDLVMSFGEKAQMGQGRVPAEQMVRFVNVQQGDLYKFRALPVSGGTFQRKLLPNPRPDQPLSSNLGPVQEGQLAAGPVFGLSGSRFPEIAGRFTSGVQGNIPNIEELMQPGEETYRPKLKGRRGHGSQDEK